MAGGSGVQHGPRAQFCERCGRDSSEFASAHLAFHDCPSCGVTCCSTAGTLSRPPACAAPVPAPRRAESRASCLDARTPRRRVPTAETPSASASTVGRRGTTRLRRYGARHRVPAGPGSAAAPGEHADAPRSRVTRLSESRHPSRLRSRSPASSRSRGVTRSRARGTRRDRGSERGLSWRPWRSQRSAQRRAGPRHRSTRPR